MIATPVLATDAVSALARCYVDEEGPDAVLRRIAELAAAAGPADMVGITLVADGARPRTAACTHPVAGEIDALQCERHGGPCLHAISIRRPCRADTAEADRLWPGLGTEAASRGVRVILSLPVLRGGDAMGAVNLYSGQVAALDDGAADRLAGFADQAAVALANSQAYWATRRLSENLQAALGSRATIDHAIGILLAGGAPTPEEAFQILVRASQRENRKLRDIAADIVARATQRNNRRASTSSSTEG